MSDLPFAISQEAAATLEKAWLSAQQDIQLLAMERVLGYAFNSSWTNTEGGWGRYPFPSVILGWHPPEDVVGNSEYTELELVGFRMFAHQKTLELLQGKQIILVKGKGRSGGDILAVHDLAANTAGARRV